ncbi:hypothetical protein Tco_1079758 [Tanacetum coccineum]|uniref:Uncharacterized protein n=1 Tax=Tanacetum coccineum TaxID=301880 RepID=A0ABQ5HSW7_9ASTR
MPVASVCFGSVQAVFCDCLEFSFVFGSCLVIVRLLLFGLLAYCSQAVCCLAAACLLSVPCLSPLLWLRSVCLPCLSAVGYVVM